MRSLLRPAGVAILFVSVVLLAGSLSYATKYLIIDTEDEQAVERVVREYILKNPEIIIEALRYYQNRQRVADTEKARERVRENQEQIFKDSGSPVGGNPDGDVTLVEFFDYRCPYCKAVAPRLSRLLDEDGNIRFIYKEWPILGAVSVVAARAALAARKQGKYLEFHDVLMNASGNLTKQAIFDAAKELDLDLDQLRRDMDSPEVDEILRRNMSLARTLGLNGTPGFVIGDNLVPGAIELPAMKALVKAARDGGDGVSLQFYSPSATAPRSGSVNPGSSRATN